MLLSLYGQSTEFGMVRHHLWRHLGGNYVVINEDLHEEFEGFKKKVYMYVDSTFYIVEAMELLHIWCLSDKFTLKTMHVHRRTYFQISVSHLDTFCKWVYDKRQFFSCKENFSIKMLVDCDEESRLKQVDDTDNESNNIPYWPVCEGWQKSVSVAWDKIRQGQCLSHTRTF